MCTSSEAKRFCTLCFSSSFLFNIVIVRHFITVNTLDMVESGCSRTWRMSIILWIRWSPGIICTIVPTVSIPRWGEDRWVKSILAKAKIASGEDRRYLVLRQNHTRVQWRKNVPSLKTESELYVCTRVSTNCKADQTHKHWIHPH